MLVINPMQASGKHITKTYDYAGINNFKMPNGDIP